MSWRRFLYTLAFYSVLPAILVRLLWRSRQQPAYRQNLGQRLGFVKPRLRHPPCIVLHMVSVGETMAARPLVEALLQQYPHYTLWLTSTTPTGAATVQRLFSSRVQHSYLPYDLPNAVGRFLQRVKPQLLLVMETELWPNLYAACAQRQIPLALLNARLSQRSLHGYQRVAGLVRETLQSVAWIAAREPSDADAFIQLGASPETVQVMGNIKFDLAEQPALQQQALAVRQAGPQRLIWVAASTHPEEEIELLQAHALLLKQQPTALLILVPRHPERFASVAELVQAQGFTLQRRSGGDWPAAATQVYLGDSMGELLLWYALADAAFIGGSLVKTGGHNPLEAALFAVPVLSGPHVHNFQALYSQLMTAGGGMWVESAEDLAHYLTDWWRDPQQRKKIGQAGQLFLYQHQGVVERLMQRIQHTLDGSTH